jgi:hypothetical protein
MTIAKLNGIDPANIATINGVPIASIANINGQVLALGTAPAAPTNLILSLAAVDDTFSDVGTVNLINHTPNIDQLGGGWYDLVTPTNPWQVSGGLLQRNTGAVVSPVIDSGLSDCTIEMDIDTAATETGVLPRNTSTSTIASWRVAFTNSNARLKIFEGVTEQASQVVTGFTPGVLTVILSGQTITAQFPNTPDVIYAGAAANETVTVHGIYMSSDAGRITRYTVSA